MEKKFLTSAHKAQRLPPPLPTCLSSSSTLLPVIPSVPRKLSPWPLPSHASHPWVREQAPRLSPHPGKAGEAPQLNSIPHLRPDHSSLAGEDGDGWIGGWLDGWMDEAAGCSGGATGATRCSQNPLAP